MDIITMILVAIGLAMDAFAVSITIGVSLDFFVLKSASRVAAFFGFFQAFMPVLGWASGLLLRQFTKQYSHWIAFSILLFIGIKMIYEAFRIEQDTEKNHFKTSVLFGLAIATSIDAFAVGVTFSILKQAVLIPIILIGIITWIFSFFGVFLGNKLGEILGNKAEILGGIILLVIAFKLLLIS